MMVLLICPLLSSFVSCIVHNVVFDVVLHVFLNKVDHEIVFIFAVREHSSIVQGVSKKRGIRGLVL